MAIQSEDQYLAAPKQTGISINKTVSRTAVALAVFAVFDLAGSPGAGTLPGTSATAGVVPTASTAGCPPLNAFAGANLGYIGRIQWSNTVSCRMALYDMVWKGGTYAFTAATTTVTAPPSYSGRMPGGTDYTGTEIWIEVSTAFVTGTSWSVVVTYTNQSGTTGRSTIAFTGLAAAALTLGKRLRLALQAGDSGVQKIESVIVTNGGTAMTAGAINVLVRRFISGERIRVANDVVTKDLYGTGMPQVFATSAFDIDVIPDSTATGLPEVYFDLANG